ncbi:5,6-dimethylbenzimidazole synthase [Stomatohabitans albus]|uniref:5,6-dimethylbenzimidazole synthase n=1 Tax=Stomatohabitans albus TaxID=3110766 RepID=UPI00300C1427
MTTPFHRPQPTIGDRTSAQARAADPRGWAMDNQVRDHLYSVIDARRDIRRYRPDPIDEPTLERILVAAHHGPSVGHSQPWRFIVITDDHLRAQATVMADRCRIEQAQLLDPAAARNLLDLQLEGIREAPVGIVVACDRRVPNQGVLGRATFADSDMWSCAAAIENLWLAARAEGLGMGWVTLFKPDELRSLLGLPDGVETLGWLCLGWPDERPPSPGLERRGWSKRLPLEDVVIYDRWPEEDRPSPVHRLAPDEPVHHIDHADKAAAFTPESGIAVAVSLPTQEGVVAARDAADNLLTPPGSLGLVDQILDRANAIHPDVAADGHLVLVGADHPVTRHAVSAFESHVTADVMHASVQGKGFGTALAQANGFGFSIIDAGVNEPIAGAIMLRPQYPQGDLSTTDALHHSDVLALIEGGETLGSTLPPGLICLGEVGVGNTTVAAALAARLLDVDPAQCIGLGAGADTAMTERKLAVVHAALTRTAAADPDPIAILAGIGGPEFCVLTGILLGATANNRVVVLDGLATTLPAIIAQRLAPGVQSHLIASHRSREAAHGLALAHLGLEPIGDWRLRAGEGAGAVLAAGLLGTVHRGRVMTARTIDPMIR